MTNKRFPLGGKAAGLVKLKKLGCAVPPFALWQEETLPEHGEGGPDAGRTASQLRDAILQLPWSREAEQKLAALLGKIGEPLAVRSSAADEDGAGQSLAGQMDTFLNVRGLEALKKAVRACQASVYSDRAMAYREARGLPRERIPLTVVVQRMVQAKAAGVLFSRNWVEGQNDRMLVSSVWGLGEGLVSGVLDSDQFFLDEKAVLRHSIIAEKTARVVQDGQGTRTEACPPELVLQPSLSANVLGELGRTARRVRKALNCEIDMEFAVEDGKLYCLQVRPITSLGKDNIRIWDNSNITESYPGITQPLTFTFIRRAYEGVYRQFCAVCGVSEAILDANRDLFPNMLGHIKGRVYYNLLSWYRVVSFLPGFSFNKPLLEEMMGLTRARQWAPSTPPHGFFRRWLVDFPLLTVNFCRILWMLVFLSGRVQRFFAQFYAWYQPRRRTHWKSQSTEALLSFRQELENRILGAWKAPILNDLKCMVFFGLLRRLCKAWLNDKHAANLLVSGDPTVKSRKAVAALEKLCETAAGQEAVARLVLEREPAAAWQALGDDSRCRGFLAECRAYLDEYGLRCVEEMKLETIPLRDDPARLISLVAGALRQRKAANPQDRGQDKSEEQRLDLLFRLRGLKGLLFRRVAALAREGVRDRENQRFCRTEVYGVMRDVALEIGRRLVEAGLLQAQRDVFWLEFEELWSAIGGTLTVDRLDYLVEARKKAYKDYEALWLPDQLETDGVTYQAVQGQLRQGSASSSERTVQGLPTGTGTVTGRIKILLRPDTETRLNGEILVAPWTDPGWALLFPSISGLIVEKGSLLSHSAIIAREMRLPAIVAVPDACRFFRDGDLVRLNGTSGLAEILEREHESDS